MSIFNVNIYIKNKAFITQRVIFQFLSNLRRLKFTFNYCCEYIFEGLEETEI